MDDNFNEILLTKLSLTLKLIWVVKHKSAGKQRLKAIHYFFKKTSIIHNIGF